MTVGNLRHRVELRALSGVRDADGHVSDGWSLVATVWADIRTESGAESIKADHPTSIVRASIRIRWRTDIKAGMRAVLGTTIYEIKAVKPDLVRRDRVDLVCEVVDG